MTQQDIETLRGGYEAFNQADIPDRQIGDPTAHRAILEELDQVAAGHGHSTPLR